ncbi:DNA-directed RNA polymerase subunit D [Methanothermococcus okinawensis]|uniref:DNA-directed RNA polymerase subunit Rpo3 n=1 Tax=Methanothermococcus okinawensis (strain DSM 14208 / JCM 11175 / IH1) TaxID=647113 RepID=F8AN60_METOI|nr:DNA-directed RNA polymerase subunit D [Methanothermococcus okinawensis]AEH06976.1 DNA-directed RNA polymerase [Methanothermococcus okinawensis IH1]
MINNIQKEKTRIGERLKFNLKAPLSFSSALRRIMISETPTYAIENVYFYENTSSMYDELIAHRLGLIPIKGKPVSNDEVIIFALIKEGPCVVYSGDLESETGEVVFKHIPIVKLKEGQKLELECEALVGTGKTHAKWQPCNAVYKLLNNDEVEFLVESYGNMDSEDLLISSVEILKNKAEKFLYELESLEVNDTEQA